MLATRKLSALLPASRTLPSMPPLIVPARVSRRNLPLGFTSPWHSTQDFSKRGLTSLSKVRPCLSDGGGSLLVSMCVALALKDIVSAVVKENAVRGFMVLSPRCERHHFAP